MSILSDEKAFLKKYRLDEADYNRTGLKWDQLNSIYEAYLKEMPQIRALENYFSDCLKSVANVHSVITRLKDPERLIETLIRKKISDRDLEITIKNYNEIVTDLVEVRVLHLFKEDWEDVHEYITNKWVLKEKPTAYVREGDDREQEGRNLLASYEQGGCNVRFHNYGYRSITYLAISSIDNKTNYIEVLSRTIFEEGWNTIDQCIRDSHDIDSPVLMQYLSHFSHRIADMADEMGSFLYKYVEEEHERNGKLSDKARQQIEEPRPDSKKNEKELPGLEYAQKTGNKDASGNYESTTTPQQPVAPPIHTLKKKEEAPDTKKNEHAISFKELLNTQKGKLSQEQPVTDVKQDEYPKIQPGILEALRDDHQKEEENGQKFTFSKLKQAIQGITPKTTYQDTQQIKK